MSLLGTALSYAGRGWPVLPCRGKIPLLEHGVHQASDDAERIRSWWSRWPEANIGVRTGVAVDVIDVDSPEGLEALFSVGAGRPLGWGPIARTGKGWHYYVKCTGLRSKIRFVPGVDLKAADSYVIGPPSWHPSGRRYEWFQDCGPEYRTPQPAPEWLVRLLNPPTRTTSGRLEHCKQGGGYARAALRLEAASVANAAEGSRNDTLNRAAFRMRRFVEAGELGDGEVFGILLSAAVLSGLGDLEAQRTIRSGLGRGT